MAEVMDIRPGMPLEFIARISTPAGVPQKTLSHPAHKSGNIIRAGLIRHGHFQQPQNVFSPQYLAVESVHAE